MLVGALGHMVRPESRARRLPQHRWRQAWKKTLFVDEQTGVVDLAVDPAASEPASMPHPWTARNWPWLSYFTPIEGEGSAIWHSCDVGPDLDAPGWRRLAHRKAGPDRTCASPISTAGATRIYASIDSAEHGGLYRSDDGGAHWQRVNDASAVTSWYESRLTVAPNDPDTLYTVGQSIHKSTDAGKTFTIIKGAPGGDDYHHIWINPKHPERMITAADQGTVVSVNGGETWSDWYNQPTGQFYHLATDNRFPVLDLLRSAGFRHGRHRQPQRLRRDQLPRLASGRRRRARFRHSRSGGSRHRLRLRARRAHLALGCATPEKCRTFRLGRSRATARAAPTSNTATPGSRRSRSRRSAPYALYSGSQVLFRSLDRGQNWEVISPDLTGAERREGLRRRCPDPNATACGYGVIYAITPSPHDNNEIWIGTDNGRIQMTRDGGKSWKKSRPKRVPDWAKISSLDVSALDPGTAYAAIDNHRQDDFRPGSCARTTTARPGRKSARAFPKAAMSASSAPIRSAGVCSMPAPTMACTSHLMTAIIGKPAAQPAGGLGARPARP